MIENINIPYGDYFYMGMHALEGKINEIIDHVNGKESVKLEDIRTANAEKELSDIFADLSVVLEEVEDKIEIARNSNANRSTVSFLRMKNNLSSVIERLKNL